MPLPMLMPVGRFHFSAGQVELSDATAHSPRRVELAPSK